MSIPRAELIKFLEKQVDAKFGAGLVYGKGVVGGKKKRTTKKGKGLVYGAGVVGGKRKATAAVKASRRAGSLKNPWVLFLKSYSKQHGMSYMDALRDPMAKATYRGKGVVGGKGKGKKK